MSKFFHFHWDTFRFKLKRNFFAILQSNNSDRSIAWGYALGTFIAILPTPGFSTMIGLVMIAIFRRINKIAVFIAMAVWNAVTVLPVYYLSLEIGAWLLKDIRPIHFQYELLDKIFHYIRQFVIGNLFVSIPISLASYYLALFVLRKLRMNREKRFKIKRNKNLNV